MEYKKILIRLLIAFAVLSQQISLINPSNKRINRMPQLIIIVKTNVHGGHLNVAHKSVNLFLIDGAMLKIGITMHVNQNMRLVVHQENLLSCNQLQDIMDMSQLLNKYIKTVVLKFQNTTFIAH